jgi:hypothetical protein
MSSDVQFELFCDSREFSGMMLVSSSFPLVGLLVLDLLCLYSVLTPTRTLRPVRVETLSRGQPHIAVQQNPR